MIELSGCILNVLQLIDLSLILFNTSWRIYSILKESKNTAVLFSINNETQWMERKRTKNFCPHHQYYFILFLLTWHLLIPLCLLFKRYHLPMKKPLFLSMKQPWVLTKEREIHVFHFFISGFTVSVTPSLSTPDFSCNSEILIILSISLFKMNKVNPFLAFTNFSPTAFQRIFLSELFITDEVF